jgi:glutamate-1-semialdehyde 2,1-aminomutase
MPLNSSKRLSFDRSEALLRRALEIIPLGTQTFSKSYTQYPLGVAPFYAERAQGSQVWDVDGNQYTDFVNALASITLGHCDPDITEAVTRQLGRGTIFSLASEIEIEVAELIIDMVPCAEQVRFGKNGSDATSGAIRAARAFTGRDRVAVCGYHGWQDWYIASTARNKGVPAATRALTHSFIYNDLNSLEAVFAANPGTIAAVILEPMNANFPTNGFLEDVADLTRQQGAVLVFDETITGFRYANGGAQELFGVTPDLATFGKGLANGYPLAAVAGRGEIMKEFEEIFFSFTMGGETLSLAAAKAALEKLRREPVVETLAATGERLIAGVNELIVRHSCQSFLSIRGHPSWTFLAFGEVQGVSVDEVKTLWMQEILARNILSVGTHNVSYAHSAADVEGLLNVYDEVFPILREAVEAKSVKHFLRCEPLVPLFRLR